jgi:hypothetical protein
MLIFPPQLDCARRSTPDDSRAVRPQNNVHVGVRFPEIAPEAEATKAAQRAGIEHAKQHEDRAYLGRKPSFTRHQLDTVRDMLGQQAVGVAQIAKATGLSRQTVYRIKDDPAGL